MPRRIFAHPRDGVLGTIDDHGQRVRGTYYLAAYAYGPDETPPAGMDTLTRLRGLHGATQGLLVVPFTGETTFTFGPDVLSLPGDRVIVRNEFLYAASGPAPELCSCGKVSVRHAVSYHGNDAGSATTALA